MSPSEVNRPAQNGDPSSPHDSTQNSLGEDSPVGGLADRASGTRAADSEPARPSMEQKNPSQQVLLPRDDSSPAPPQWKPKPFWKAWWFEILSLLVAFAALVVIVVVLSEFDQRNLPNWPLAITLNTFLAFFATLAKAAFMIPVSSAISRAQWTWFRRERPLHDFHLFDQASRGPWGSLALIWRVRARRAVALGALLTVVAALTSPLSQLAISYPLRDTVAADETAVVRAVNDVRYPRDRVDLGARRALLLVTVADATDFAEPIRPTNAFCSTGNCTFDAYHSLGVCMSMANITEHLSVEAFPDAQPGDVPMLGDPDGEMMFPNQTVYRASLPGGYNLTHQAPMALLSEMLNGADTFGFRGDAALAEARLSSHVLVYAAPQGANLSDGAAADEVLRKITGFKHEALEVLFHLCAQTYETRVRVGEETTQMVGEHTRPVKPGTGSFLDVQCKSLANDGSLGCVLQPDRADEVIELEAPPGAGADVGSFSADYGGLEAMASLMKKSLTGYAVARWHPVVWPEPEVSFQGGDFVQALFQDVVFSLDVIEDRSKLPRRVSNIYDNVAVALSSMIRDGQHRTYAKEYFNVTGTPWKETSYVHITWGWIAFLAAELALAATFLVMTAFQCASTQWRGSKKASLVPTDIKDSSLATMTVLGAECRAIIGEGLQPMDELVRRSKGLLVRLQGAEVVPVGKAGDVESDVGRGMPSQDG